MLCVFICAMPLASNHTQDQIRSKIVIMTVVMKAVLLCGTTSCSLVKWYCRFRESYYLLVQDRKVSLRWRKWSREVGFTPPTPLSSCLLPEILLSTLPLILCPQNGDGDIDEYILGWLWSCYNLYLFNEWLTVYRQTWYSQMPTKLHAARRQ